jgi:hypothetical protein
VIEAGGREKVEHHGGEAVQRGAKLVSGGDRGFFKGDDAHRGRGRMVPVRREEEPGRRAL